MCGNTPAPIESFDPSILRNAMAADASRPLHFRALIEVDQLHALLDASRMLDVGEISLTTLMRREINPTEIS